MTGMEESQPVPYWSYTTDQRIEPIRTSSIATTTAIKAYTPSTPNNVYNVVPYNPPRPAALTSSTMSSYTLPTTRRTSNSDGKKKQRQRIMSYNAYTYEGKVKASIRNGFRWVKNKYCSILHRY